VASYKGISLIPSNPAIPSNAVMSLRILLSPISAIHSSRGYTLTCGLHITPDDVVGSFVVLCEPQTGKLWKYCQYIERRSYDVLQWWTCPILRLIYAGSYSVVRVVLFWYHDHGSSSQNRCVVFLGKNKKTRIVMALLVRITSHMGKYPRTQDVLIIIRTY